MPLPDHFWDAEPGPTPEELQAKADAEEALKEEEEEDDLAALIRGSKVLNFGLKYGSTHLPPIHIPIGLPPITGGFKPGEIVALFGNGYQPSKTFMTPKMYHDILSWGSESKRLDPLNQIIKELQDQKGQTRPAPQQSIRNIINCGVRDSVIKAEAEAAEATTKPLYDLIHSSCSDHIISLDLESRPLLDFDHLVMRSPDRSPVALDSLKAPEIPSDQGPKPWWPTRSHNALT